jgi:imidazolonepropionase-like amidohydrolase
MTRPLACVLAAWVAIGAAQAETLAIVHARAWTMTAPAPLDDATIVVVDGRIARVAAGTAPPSDARVVDAAGRNVTPGRSVGCDGDE